MTSDNPSNLDHLVLKLPDNYTPERAQELIRQVVAGIDKRLRVDYDPDGNTLTLTEPVNIAQEFLKRLIENIRPYGQPGTVSLFNGKDWVTTFNVKDTDHEAPLNVNKVEARPGETLKVEPPSLRYRHGDIFGSVDTRPNVPAGYVVGIDAAYKSDQFTLSSRRQGRLSEHIRNDDDFPLWVHLVGWAFGAVVGNLGALLPYTLASGQGWSWGGFWAAWLASFALVALINILKRD